MKVIDVKNLEATSRCVICPGGGFKSIRPVLKSDGMGYSVTVTTIYPMAGPQVWHYKNHLESCYCIEGKAKIKNLDTGEMHSIYPGVIYVLDKHDKHEFTAITEVKLICVFNPPLNGTEVHNKERSYERE